MPSMPTSNWPSLTAGIMASQDESFQSTVQFSRRQISLTASYSQPTALPVAGSTKLSGVYAFSVTAATFCPFRSGN